MAISFVNSGSNVVTSTGAITLTLPSGMQPGDVVYVVVNCNATTNITFTEGTGTWTKLSDQFRQDTSSSNMSSWRKVMGSPVDTDVTVTGTASFHYSAACVVLRGVDNTTPEDVTSVVTGGIDSGIPDCPAITTVTDGTWVLACAGSTEPTAATVPTGYENLIEATNGVNATHAVISTKLIATAGAEDPAAYTGFSGSSIADAWTAVTIAARPAAAAVAVMAGGGIGKKKRRRIRLDDGRILIPSDDMAYRRAVEQIIANIPEPQPQKPRKRKFKGAVKSLDAIPKLAPVRTLPGEFYEALANNTDDVLNSQALAKAWADFLALDEEETELLLLAS